MTLLRKVSDVSQHVGFIGCDNPAALPGLARKVPHYGKYGFLVFMGDAPRNVKKDEWPVRDSPLTVVFDPGHARFPPRLPPRRALQAGL